MSEQRPILTTASGFPIGDNQNSVTIGARGPVLLQDFHLLEKNAHFNRERIPERVVHAKGSGAFGTFRVTNDVTRWTKAKLFNQIGKETEVLARFSTVAGEKGSADSVRDPRGFAVKFYTEDGNWDMVGNNTPVFFVRDGIKFPDFIHTQKRDPRTNMKNPDAMWDFWSLSPECLHQLTILFSGRGTPKSYRHMNGYSSHTYSWINAAGERVWIKLHFKTMQGIQNNTDAEALRIAGEDPDSATRDLFNAIESGDYPKWRVCVQIMTQEQADSFKWNPFDLTKVWPHAQFPLIEIGIMELNRNPENYFVDIEQSAFAPTNIVPGMGFSPDKMLQARIFSYPDAHRYRLGVNYELLPPNAPRKTTAQNYQRDGFMRFDANGGRSVNYEPNSFGGPAQSAEYNQPDYGIEFSGLAQRYDHREVDDHYEQPRALFRLMTPEQREELLDNMAGAASGAQRRFQERWLGVLLKCDEEYAAGFAKRLGLPMPTTAATR